MISDSLRPLKLALLVALVPLWMMGCSRANQLQFDQSQIRQTLLELYTDQLMDNLIRIRLGLPIIHLDYSSITGQVTTSGKGTVNGARESTHNNLDKTPGSAANPATAAFPILEVIRRSLGFSLEATKNNQISIKAEPVTNNNEVYDAYLRFLEDPNRLKESECIPEGAVHQLRRIPVECITNGKTVTKDRYFWIPKEYAKDFLKLELATTAQRGQPLSRPEFFENTILGVIEEIPIKGLKHGYRLVLDLKKPVNNASGNLIMMLNGRQSEFGIEWIEERDGEPVAYGAKTTRLHLPFASKPAMSDAEAKKERDDFVKGLQNKDIRLRLEGFRPDPPTTEILLEAIREQIELDRLNHFIQ